MSEKVKGREHSGNLGVDNRIHGFRVWTVFVWLRIGSSEHGNVPSGSIITENFLTSCVIVSQEGVSSMYAGLFLLLIIHLTSFKLHTSLTPHVLNSFLIYLLNCRLLQYPCIFIMSHTK